MAQAHWPHWTYHSRCRIGINNEQTPIYPMFIPKTPRITLIAALASNRVIGAGNAIPWRLPEDLRRFKLLTLGHPIIMGRKTWQSLGRPLPGRTNIVISRSADFTAPGGAVAASLAAAVALAADTGTDEVFIIGGAELYAQALPIADCLQLTEINQAFAGDAYFPAFDATQWRETARQSHQAQHAEAGFDYAFVTYERR